MRTARLLGHLEALAEQLGIQVSYEPLSPCRSGLCRLRGHHFLYVDQNLTDEQQVEVFVAALSRFQLEHLQMLPRIRRMLEAQSASGVGGSQ